MCTLGSIHSLAYRHKYDRSFNDDIERTHQPYPISVNNQNPNLESIASWVPTH